MCQWYSIPVPIAVGTRTMLGTYPDVSIFMLEAVHKQYTGTHLSLKNICKDKKLTKVGNTTAISGKLCHL